MAIIFFCLPVLTLADCSDINKFKLGLSVHGSNWVNATTTKTPAGGPYIPKAVQCNQSCQIIEVPTFFMRYEPKHPDANTHGYVQYPDIDKEKERAAIASYAKSIDLVSAKCNSKILTVSNDDSLLIKYINDEIKADIFNFDKSNKVISWIREDKSGKTQILNF